MAVWGRPRVRCRCCVNGRSDRRREVVAAEARGRSGRGGRRGAAAAIANARRASGLRRSSLRWKERDPNEHMGSGGYNKEMNIFMFCRDGRLLPIITDRRKTGIYLAKGFA